MCFKREGLTDKDVENVISVILLYLEEISDYAYSLLVVTYQPTFQFLQQQKSLAIV